MKKLLMILPVIGLILLGCGPEARYKRAVKKRGPIPQPKYSIDLSQLDSIPCIYYWEVQDGRLQVWTVGDEVENELERLRYLKENFYE